MACPKCNNDDWKLASLVYKEGLTHVETTSKGVGAGVSTSGIGIGVGQSKTGGMHQSEISKLAAPPEPKLAPRAPATKFDIIFGSLGLCVFGWFFSNWWYLVSLILFLIMWSLWKPEDEIPKEFVDERMIEWEKSRVCQRCGYLYQP